MVFYFFLFLWFFCIFNLSLFFSTRSLFLSFHSVLQLFYILCTFTSTRGLVHLSLLSVLLLSLKSFSSTHGIEFSFSFCSNPFSIIFSIRCLVFLSCPSVLLPYFIISLFQRMVFYFFLYVRFFYSFLTFGGLVFLSFHSVFIFLSFTSTCGLVFIFYFFLLFLSFMLLNFSLSAFLLSYLCLFCHSYKYFFKRCTSSFPLPLSLPRTNKSFALYF